MPRPTSDTAVPRPDLGVLAREYMDQGPTMGFIGLEVMPIIEVPKSNSHFPVMPKEAMLTVQDTSRAPRGRYNRSDYEFEDGHYDCKENGWEELVDDSERALYADLFDAEAAATERAVGIIMRSQEKRIADKIFNATNFTAHAITHEWDDATNAVPITDVNTGALAVRSACGMLPDTLIIAYSTFVNLKSCSQIIDRIKYTFPGLDINRMTSAQLAAAFNVSRVLVGGAVYNSAKKGQSATITDLWSNEYAMLCVTSDRPDIRSPCIGRTFLWTGDSQTNEVVESYRDEGARSDVIRVRHNTGETLIKSYDSDGTVKSDISAACAYLMSNITT